MVSHEKLCLISLYPPLVIKFSLLRYTLDQSKLPPSLCNIRDLPESRTEMGWSISLVHCSLIEFIQLISISVYVLLYFLFQFYQFLFISWSRCSREPLPIFGAFTPCCDCVFLNVERAIVYSVANCSLLSTFIAVRFFSTIFFFQTTPPAGKLAPLSVVYLVVTKHSTLDAYGKRTVGTIHGLLTHDYTSDLSVPSSSATDSTTRLAHRLTVAELLPPDVDLSGGA